MKLVISSAGPAATDRVDPRFGRARYLIKYDSASESYVAIDNAAQVNAPQGAGIQAAQKVAELGADALLTGHCGPKAFDVLSEAGVTIYAGLEGTVLEAVSAWRDNTLESLAAPDRKAHH